MRMWNKRGTIERKGGTPLNGGHQRKQPSRKDIGQGAISGVNPPKKARKEKVTKQELPNSDNVKKVHLHLRRRLTTNFLETPVLPGAWGKTKMDGAGGRTGRGGSRSAGGGKGEEWVGGFREG